MPTLLAIEDARLELHDTPPGHPEAPARLRAVGRALAARREALALRPARLAEDDELLAVHPRAHLDRVEDAARRAPAHLDPDTFASSASAEVARLAAGAASDAALAVARGDAPFSLAAVRPPGHHAEADRAMGFCLFNNVAVAVRALQAQAGVERVLVLDWDVHHGNGTQHLFEADADVFYASIHQFPFYPGTGAAGEIGVGRGENATLNVPLPPGCSDAEYLHAVARLVAPAAAHFRPDFVLVSCGFDAHRDDPLGGMTVSSAAYGGMTHQLRALAEALCGGRLAFVLEGGYSARGLEESTGAVLDACLAARVEEPRLPELPPASPLWGVIESLRAAHGASLPGLGPAT